MVGTRAARHVLASVAVLVLVLFSLGSTPAFANGHHRPSSGDTSSPQPNSRADNNDGGANGQCPGGTYCSTRDGSASQNGSGDGNAKGKPCAGCVGKADNKNPKGQKPNGSDDGNSGYECDNNNGVGKSNPAHTGCTAGPSPSSDESPSSGESAAPGAKGSDDSTPSAEVRGVQASQGKQGANRSAPKIAPSSGLLPNTGANTSLTVMFVAGIALLLFGLFALHLRRREGSHRA